MRRKTQPSGGATARPNDHDDPEAVSAFMSTLVHPLKPLIETVRGAILNADRSISEGIKWNTASFYCHGWFATINIRARTGVQLVLHHGAKTRADSTLSQTIDDSAHLLTWLAPDRATITFASPEEFERRNAGFRKVIQQWAQHQALFARTA